MKKKISGGSARLGQLMIILFFCPFLGLILHLMINMSLSSDALIFLLILTILIFIIISIAFRFSDIYISNKYIVVKKLFSVSKVPFDNILKVGKSLFPFSYYLKSKKKRKIIFFSNTSDIFKSITSGEIDYIPEDLKVL